MGYGTRGKLDENIQLYLPILTSLGSNLGAIFDYTEVDDEQNTEIPLNILNFWNRSAESPEEKLLDFAKEIKKLNAWRQAIRDWHTRHTLLLHTKH